MRLEGLDASALRKLCNALVNDYKVASQRHKEEVDRLAEDLQAALLQVAQLEADNALLSEAFSAGFEAGRGYPNAVVVPDEPISDAAMAVLIENECDMDD